MRSFVVCLTLAMSASASSAAVIPEELMKEFVELYTTSIDPKKPIGKSYKDLTAQDLRRFSSEDLHWMRLHFNDEQYKYTDPLLPTNMSRAEFSTAILTELARSDPDKLRESFVDIFSSSAPNLRTQMVTVQRAPLKTGGKVASPETVRQLGVIVALRDGLAKMMQDHTNVIAMAPDVAQQVGRERVTVQTFRSPLRLWEYGFIAGSLPHFRPGIGGGLSTELAPDEPKDEDVRRITDFINKTKAENAAARAKKAAENQAAGRPPRTQEQVEAELNAEQNALQDKVNQMVKDTLQANYCDNVNKLFEGKGDEVKPNVKILTGFLQARKAFNDGYPARDRIGLFGDCPSRAASKSRPK